MLVWGIIKLMKHLLKKIIPESVLSLYHYLLAVAANYWYHKPSEEMIVIGVTGTKGKSTVVNLTGRMLEESGFEVGWVTSLNVKIRDDDFLNPWHMTMPGRFKLQKFLRKMADRGCQYALVEVTSEGIKQWRHLGINFDTVCFTNLAPEHLEAHGGFEAYKKTKGRIFKNLSGQERKKLPFSPYLGQQVPKIIAANRDDEQSEYFLHFDADRKFSFGLEKKQSEKDRDRDFIPSNYEAFGKGIKFRLDSTVFESKLLGKFNVYNALAALTLARSQRVDFVTIKKALAKVKGLPGRMEFIDQGQDFEVIVDLAHTPDSFEAVFKTVKKSSFVVSGFRNMICVFGAAGGGRDEWKRPRLGEIADQYCDQIILTNEDPYREDPDKIIDDIAQGVDNKDKLHKVKNRRKAIRKAFQIADKKDVVLLLGKGTEATMVIGGKEFDWDERKVAEEELEKVLKK